MHQSLQNRFTHTVILSVAGCALWFLQACTSKQEQVRTESPNVSVITIDTTSSIIYKSFSSTLEGIANIEIRPQAEGYLEKIYVDEGTYVHKGQSLFLINDKLYNEQLNSTNATLLTAKAHLEKAKIEVNRLQKLVSGKVISQVQLDNANTEFDAAKAGVAQAESAQKSAFINKGFTLVKAPVNGYIGRIPYKVGSLIGRNEPQPLTLLSDIHEMYAYFSMSERDFLQFKQRYPGNTIEEKIKNIPPVSLLLPDNSEYSEKGKVQMVQGQFDPSTAAITFRVSFPNINGLLRSGNTGTVILAQNQNGVIKIPQTATFEIQNKIMAYVIGKGNKISNIPLKIADKDDASFIVTEGLKPGDRIISTGLERLHENMVVKPLNQ